MRFTGGNLLVLAYSAIISLVSVWNVKWSMEDIGRTIREARSRARETDAAYAELDRLQRERSERSGQPAAKYPRR